MFKTEITITYMLTSKDHSCPGFRKLCYIVILPCSTAQLVQRRNKSCAFCPVFVSTHDRSETCSTLIIKKINTISGPAVELIVFPLVHILIVKETH